MSDQGEHWVRQLVEAVRERLRGGRRAPIATYRLQFHREHLPFDAAAGLIGYLHDLGISDVYASPCLQARSGSEHGYDVVDPNRLNHELGGAEGFHRFAAALHERGMGQFLDIVPNHMAVTSSENVWWQDVLENGPASVYADFFDINWRPLKIELRNKLLLPVLGDHYGRVLESGQIRLTYEHGAFRAWYYEMSFPLEPRSYTVLLSHGIEALGEALGAEAEDFVELESIITALQHLPPAAPLDPPRREERQREKEVIKQRLHHLTSQSSDIARFIERNVSDFNGRPGDPESFDALDRLLNIQAYRLAYWKTAGDEINYRRFFDVNDLASVRMELGHVFDAAHRLVFDLLVEGRINGLRIDHVDGLLDPVQYLRRLQRGYLRTLGRAEHERLRGRDDASPPPWPELEPAFIEAADRELNGGAETSGDRDDDAEPVDPTNGPSLLVLAEKILAPGETLPPGWPVDGTTGYDFLNLANGLLIDPDGYRRVRRFYQRFTEQGASFADVAYRCKQLILDTVMTGQLQELATELNQISERDRLSRDFTLNTLRDGLREILACFPVYRTYIDADGVSERDRSYLHAATGDAERRNPELGAGVLRFVRDTLLLERPRELDEPWQQQRLRFVERFQQVSSTLTAKGIEDTAFYAYVPLASLNEVGGEPDRSVIAPGAFHERVRDRFRRWPRALNETSTHDTKRSEDVRARIDVLAEIPQDWRRAVARWTRMNERHRREADGLSAPDRNDEYLFYQTLVGAWPLTPPGEDERQALVQRLQAYMDKAAHEAKRRTSWLDPHETYDSALADFVAATLEPTEDNRFLADFKAFHERVVDWGLYTSLAQAVLKMTVPGVPNLYQGQELWDFSLVDPDNRRPVDFDRRRRLLAELDETLGAGSGAAELARDLAHHPRDDRLKLLVTARLLRFRRDHAELFLRGRYIPLEVRGPAVGHVCAFIRQGSADPSKAGPTSITVVPRQIARLLQPGGLAAAPSHVGPPVGEAVWGETHLLLPDGMPASLRHLFTDRPCEIEEGRLPLAAVLAEFPVAVLVSG